MYQEQYIMKRMVLFFAMKAKRVPKGKSMMLMCHLFSDSDEIKPI
jgi:hypothetical protein